MFEPDRQGAAVTETFADAATLWDLVERRAAASPDTTLLIDEAGRTLTCREFRDRAERVAAGFAAIGIGAGTRVTWQAPNRFETILASFALARLGAVQNPILHLYRHKEVGYAIKATDAEVVLVAGEWNGFDFGAMVHELTADLATKPQVIDIFADLPEADAATLGPAPSSGDEVRWIYFTSGTTSDPKGVRHTDRTLITGAWGMAAALDMQPDDVGSIAFPFAHIAGPDYFGTMLLSGFGAVLIEAFNPVSAVATFAANGATMVGGSTAFYQMYLTEQRKDPATPIIPTLRKLSGGGAPMPPEIYDEVKRELGVPICHGYGMTECPMICLGSPHDTDEQRANTVGKPVPGLELRTVDGDEQATGAGQDGEVRVKGPMVFAGYTDTAATAEAFDGEGWFRTGDVGHLRADGHLVLTGRLKDIIIRKGENISAKEIEDLLYAHPKVADVAVVGLPDRERGERVCAVVVTAEGQEPISFDEMVSTLKDAQLMTQKIPEQLEVVDELPRNQTLGKILKYKLRDDLATKPWPS
ncbi:MAG: AMP-binding protein [Microthrixaceae bacterium]|jgi:cyclohexanecarboxylate-CoA ligase|nr:AMP-binding protein [Microthrixaceae bacterium]